ncbi:hypothetical protein A0H81_04371 [Grifola frondosa]|uniref:Zn(2)-C6 fungal-type domain-containing protein n=1 Tax=Grifola frondosa TaxID=5627 RepID=A0A1C7MEQ6_GRIFR|nr:hypothetical protein A0H81_04371 [Grifola frondosa]
MSKTCNACREAKVHCDGIAPVCGPCSEADRPDCVYASGKCRQTGKAALLQKGAACRPCRRKKKKCDAKRPCCTTCKAAGKERDCLYEEDAQRNLIEALVVRTRDLERRLAQFEGQSSQEQLATPSLASAPIPSSSAPTAPSFGFNILDTDFHFSLLGSSIFFEQPPASPPPVVDTRHLTASTSVRDLWEFRTIFLAHQAQLGFNITDIKARAILAGDLSGVTIHPVLIYLAQLMGCCIWQLNRNANILASAESFQLQAISSALSGNIDPLTRLEVHNVLSVYFIIKHRLHEAMDQIQKSAKVALENNLNFILPSSESFNLLQEIEVTWEEKEHVCALSQLLYLDKTVCLVLGMPPSLKPDYEQQFKSLPIFFPGLAKDHLAILRARIALTASAELHRLLPGYHAESRQQCLDTIMQMVGIGRTFDVLDYMLLDPILAACWPIVAKVMFHELKFPLDRAAVALWSMVHASIVDCVPNIIAALPYMERPLSVIMHTSKQSGIASIIMTD